MTEPETLRWVKSSYSNNGGTCVEWAPAYATATGIVPVRDSKDPHGPALAFSANGWSSFVAAVKGGELPAA
ncbi:DUF397 domain-containing protein [Streptomyces sp. 4503]|uniref:DUF397 domain-containing protein n=2 Tax=Streptomyces niphimycinicus TaxID=2842201 RepID=A0ABS6CLC3_9ACTN|nr:DUF397 domain-containing protein [Streptomyces niphimycinicus]MBU3867717.1 DUF397 domain-containing protein [Streptomyces niphimycinicus]